MSRRRPKYTHTSTQHTKKMSDGNKNRNNCKPTELCVESHWIGSASNRRIQLKFYLCTLWLIWTSSHIIYKRMILARNAIMMMMITTTIFSSIFYFNSFDVLKFWHNFTLGLMYSCSAYRLINDSIHKDLISLPKVIVFVVQRMCSWKIHLSKYMPKLIVIFSHLIGIHIKWFHAAPTSILSIVLPKVLLRRRCGSRWQFHMFA